MEIHAPDGGLRRFRPAGHEPGDQAGERVAGAGRAEPGIAMAGRPVRPAGGGDEGACPFQDGDHTEGVRDLPGDGGRPGLDLVLVAPENAGHLARMRRDDDPPGMADERLAVALQAHHGCRVEDDRHVRDAVEQSGHKVAGRVLVEKAGPDQHGAALAGTAGDRFHGLDRDRAGRRLWTTDGAGFRHRRAEMKRDAGGAIVLELARPDTQDGGAG
jgi:hypothetical protein